MKYLKPILLRLISYRQAEGLKTFLCGLAYYSGLAHLLSLTRKRGAAILIYHSVKDNEVFWDNRISVTAFEKQIAYLARTRKIVPLSDIVARVENREHVPSDWVAVTFDDGYGDNARAAAPILRRHAGTGTFFPTVGVIDRDGTESAPFFYDWVQFVLEKTALKEVSFSTGASTTRYDLSTPPRRDDAVLRIVLSIREKPFDERIRLVRALANDCGVSLGSLRSLYLSPREMNDLRAMGMEVGSHTLSHPDLSSLPPPKAEEEISGSKREIEALVNGRIEGFAYPFGKPRHYTASTVEAVRKAGYRYAVTTSFGFVTGREDLFRLPRIAGRDACLVRLKANLLGVNL